jgi:tRNA(Ile)-lysidine synthase
MDVAGRFAVFFKKISNSAKVLAAVSTGVDSTVMLDLLLKLPRDERPQIFVAYVDHQLRAQGQQESEYIKKFCANHALPLFTAVWPVNDHPQKGIEAAARIFRYDFFQKVMEENQINELATAHQLDDQVETFLMKLIRGGRLNQLQGIKPRRNFGNDGFIIRPMLPFSKQEIRNYAKAQRLQFFEDQTNFETKVLRNRLRQIVIPQLEKENPRFKEHVIDFCQQLRLDEELLKKQRKQKLAAIQISDTQFSVKVWQTQTKAWQQKLIEMVFSTKLKNFSASQLATAHRLLENDLIPQAKIDLKAGLQFYKSYDLFGIKKVAVTGPQSFESWLKLNQWIKLPDKSQVGFFEINQKTRKLSDQVLYLKGTFHLPLKIRHRRAGDSLETKIGHQKIKKIMIDQKMTDQQRKQAWIITDANDQALWLVGSKKSCLLTAQPDEQTNYMIIFRSEVAYESRH